MIQAAIFDMDGLLIDSEPFWQRAEREIFSSLGVPITDKLAEQTATMTTKEVTKYWFNLAPWSGISLDEVEKAVVDRVEALVIENGKELQGVSETLSLLKSKGIKIGLSTNSPFQLIPVILNKLGIASHFDAISSSDEVDRGKPEPDVYLSTMDKLGVSARNCIAFEDSRSGMLAATKAKIKTVVIPHPDKYHHDYTESHLKLPSLSKFNAQYLTVLMD